MNRRESILQTAIELFCDYGFEKTKISEVAVKAGVGKGTVYEYFKSKDELLYESIKAMITHYNKGFSKIITSDKDFKEKLYEYLNHTRILFYRASVGINWINKNPPKELSNLRELIQKEQEYINTLLIEEIKKCIEKGELRSDINISAISYFIQISVMHMMVTETTMNKNCEFEIEDIINLIYQGIGV